MDSGNLFYTMNIPQGFALIFLGLLYLMYTRRDIFIDTMYIFISLIMLIDCLYYSGTTIYDGAIMAILLFIGIHKITGDINEYKQNKKK